MAAGPKRIENLVASSLFRACRVLTDLGWGQFQLHYARNRDSREIDFVVARDNEAVLAVEVKSKQRQPTRQLLALGQWFPDSQPLALQVVDEPGVLERHGTVWVLSLERLLWLLP